MAGAFSPLKMQRTPGEFEYATFPETASWQDIGQADIQAYAQAQLAEQQFTYQQQLAQMQGQQQQQQYEQTQQGQWEQFQQQYALTHDPAALEAQRQHELALANIRYPAKRPPPGPGGGGGGQYRSLILQLLGGGGGGYGGRNRQLMDGGGGGRGGYRPPPSQGDTATTDPALLAMTGSIEQRGEEAQRAIASEMARRGIFRGGPSVAASALQRGETEARIGQVKGEFAQAAAEREQRSWALEQQLFQQRSEGRLQREQSGQQFRINALLQLLGGGR